MRLDFISARTNARPEGLIQNETLVSYFKGRRADWKTGLHTSSEIIYRDLWPGIDLVYSGTMNRMKYNFIVKPGADPQQIKLAYRGAQVNLSAAGELVGRYERSGCRHSA